MKFKPSRNNVVQTETKMKRRKWLWGNLCLLLVGILLISLSITIFIFGETIYEAIINQALSFNPSSQAYKVWRKNDPPLPMDIYVFNWTNPSDIRDASVKPKFEAIGPYRFLEVKEKVNISWFDNDTISYQHKKSYYFDEKNSIRNLSDIINTINVVPLTISFKIRHMGYFLKKVVSYGLSSISSLYVTKTAREILFDGYEESILSVLSNVPMADVKDKFGIFYGKNGTFGSDGLFYMKTKNDENFGKILTWNYSNRTSFYEDECGDIKGSAGEFYPINRKRDYLVFYSAELCKYAVLEYEKDVVIKGVRGYKYSAINIFDNGTKIPENSCFCPGECLPSGVLNVSACRQNSPTFLSMPHFFGADPYYVDSIEGLTPDIDKHEFYITVEPKSGIIIEAAARMQMNMLLQSVPYISLYENLPKFVFPIFYFDQKIELKDDLASNLRLIQNLPEYMFYLGLILCSLGIISVLWTICSLYWCQRTRNINKCEFSNTRNGEDIPLNEKT